MCRPWFPVVSSFYSWSKRLILSGNMDEKQKKILLMAGDW